MPQTVVKYTLKKIYAEKYTSFCPYLDAPKCVLKVVTMMLTANEKWFRINLNAQLQ